MTHRTSSSNAPGIRPARTTADTGREVVNLELIGRNAHGESHNTAFVYVAPDADRIDRFTEFLLKNYPNIPLHSARRCALAVAQAFRNHWHQPKPPSLPQIRQELITCEQRLKKPKAIRDDIMRNLSEYARLYLEAANSAARPNHPGKTTNLSICFLKAIKLVDRELNSQAWQYWPKSRPDIPAALPRKAPCSRPTVPATTRRGRRSDPRCSPLMFALAVTYRDFTGRQPTHTHSDEEERNNSPFDQFVEGAWAIFVPDQPMPRGGIVTAIREVIWGLRPTDRKPPSKKEPRVAS